MTSTHRALSNEEFEAMHGQSKMFGDPLANMIDEKQSNYIVGASNTGDEDDYEAAQHYCD